MLGKHFLRLFGSGRLPPDSVRLVEADPSGFIAESLVCSITFRNVRAPGKYFWRRRQWFLGALAVTQKRVVAYRNRKCLVNVPWDDPRVRQIKFSVPYPGCLSLAYEASLFQPIWAGSIEIRFTTADAEHALMAIEAGLRKLCRS